MALVSQHCGAARTNKVLHYLMAENSLDDVSETTCRRRHTGS